MGDFFSRVSAQYVLHQKTRAQACMPYKMYGHMSIHSPPGRLHGRGQLHGSNVLTCCTWACTGRVGVISDGLFSGFYGSPYASISITFILFGFTELAQSRSDI